MQTHHPVRKPMHDMKGDLVPMQIILTTLSFTHQERFNFDQLNYSKNFAYYLNKVGRLQNLLVLSYDEETCLYMLRAGLLCWVDQTSPQPSDLKGESAHLGHTWISLDSEVSFLVLHMIVDIPSQLSHSRQSNDNMKGRRLMWEVTFRSKQHA